MTVSRRNALGQIAARTALLPMAGSLLLAGRAFAAPKPTPFTDIGPFYPVTRPLDDDSDLTMIKRGKIALGKVIEVSGRVLDMRGAPIAGSRVELWQANAAGRYAHAGDTGSGAIDPNFQGYGLIRTDRLGRYRYLTIMPGAYSDGDSSPRPPHVHLDISGRNDRLITQMIFPGNPLNDSDDVLARTDRSLLTARDRGLSAAGARRYEWDVILANG